MKKLLLALVLCVPVITLAQINQQCPQFTAAGAPQYQAQPGDQELCKKNYAVIHRCSVKAPVAVFEHVTIAAITGPAKRKNDFRADPAVHAECRATLQDYAGRPYDRGHMAAAANNTQSAEIMSESFFLSNMIPQVPNNNRGIWRQLEIWTRDWAKGGDFYVVSGAIYDPGHLTIGNGVGVPTRLYKIIHDRRSGQTQAYMMPNAPIPVADLPQYQTTVSAVEQATGMRFNLK
jgi:endonuclease G, mitochondrial